MAIYHTLSTTYHLCPDTSVQDAVRDLFPPSVQKSELFAVLYAFAPFALLLQALRLWEMTGRRSIWGLVPSWKSHEEKVNHQDGPSWPNPRSMGAGADYGQPRIKNRQTKIWNWKKREKLNPKTNVLVLVLKLGFSLNLAVTWNVALFWAFTWPCREYCSFSRNQAKALVNLGHMFSVQKSADSCSVFLRSEPFISCLCFSCLLLHCSFRKGISSFAQFNGLINDALFLKLSRSVLLQNWEFLALGLYNPTEHPAIFSFSTKQTPASKEQQMHCMQLENKSPFRPGICASEATWGWCTTNFKGRGEFPVLKVQVQSALCLSLTMIHKQVTAFIHTFAFLSANRICRAVFGGFLAAMQAVKLSSARKSRTEPGTLPTGSIIQHVT